MVKKKSAKRKNSKAAKKKENRKAGGVDCGKLYEFCRGLPAAAVDIKWGDHLMWTVAEKIFVGFQLGEDGGPELPFGFKCSEEEFDRLTDLPGIIPAPYAARFGWVRVEEKSAVSQKEAEELVGESYRLVVEKLPRKVREGLGETGDGTAIAKKAKR